MKITLFILLSFVAISCATKSMNMKKALTMTTMHTITMVTITNIIKHKHVHGQNKNWRQAVKHGDHTDYDHDGHLHHQVDGVLMNAR